MYNALMVSGAFTIVGLVALFALLKYDWTHRSLTVEATATYWVLYTIAILGISFFFLTCVTFLFIYMMTNDVRTYEFVMMMPYFITAVMFLSCLSLSMAVVISLVEHVEGRRMQRQRILNFIQGR